MINCSLYPYPYLYVDIRFLTLMHRYDMGSENNIEFPRLSTAMDILRDKSSQAPYHDEMIVSLHEVGKSCLSLLHELLLNQKTNNPH